MQELGTGVRKYGLSILTLGTVKSNGNKKIYVTNKNLEKSLPVGTPVITSYDKRNREITFVKAENGLGNHTISAKPNGTPVLDLKNKYVGETIGNVDLIEVQFYENKVVVKVPKNIKDKEVRANKTELSIFEIFAGSATLTNLFEQAGFISKGALELNEQNMAIYHENHKDQDTFTVCADIRNVDVDNLPKGVTVALVTPPCNAASKGNNKLREAIKNKKDGLEYDRAIIEEMEQLDSLMYYALKAVEAMNPKTIVWENVYEYTQNAYDSSLERGVYTLAKTVLKAKGYKISEFTGESHNTTRRRWTMIAHYGDEAISLDDIVIDQTKSTVQEHLAVSDKKREWKKADEFAVSRLVNNPVGIRAVELADCVTPTFSTHATRRTFPILHKVENGVDLYSAFTPEDIKNIHGLSIDYKLPREKTVAYRVLGQGVASMFKEIANKIVTHYRAERAAIQGAFQ